MAEGCGSISRGATGLLAHCMHLSSLVATACMCPCWNSLRWLEPVGLQLYVRVLGCVVELVLSYGEALSADGFSRTWAQR
jgi:hypothetical protein